ncbi:MAG TPA: FliA/WhiG family RNA polymerase sigma factor [Armatimonadota bacterium]|jgi:RNA polymerase sigma factor for flagellar operon FliA
MMATDTLWTQYKGSGSQEARQQLILNYLPLAKLAVKRLNFSPSSSVGHEDLVGHALVGLIDAVDHYDPRRNVKFETFAFMRVRGAVMDALRRMDWMPRGFRRQQGQLKQAYAKLESQHGRSATDDEVCQELGWSAEELSEVLQSAAQSLTLSLDNLMGGPDHQDAYSRTVFLTDTGSSDPFAEAAVSERRELLASAIRELTDREQLVLQLYYHEEMTLKEISHILGVTESRVCQIHSKAILRLHAHLQPVSEVLMDQAA